MPYFQCDACGCAENSTCVSPDVRFFPGFYDWNYAPERRGMNLCSACAPPMLKNGDLTMYGDWHGKFERKFLPKGMFQANGRGLLVHIITGEDYRKYVVPPPDQEKD